MDSGYKPSQNTTGAVLAESLYLTNLLLLPGLAFVFLVTMFLMKRKQTDALTRNHLQQTLTASIWAGILLIVANGLILLLGGYDGPYTWMVVIVYFTMVHSTLIILGVIGLVKAMAGQCWSYPVIGRPVSRDC